MKKVKEFEKIRQFKKMKVLIALEKQVAKKPIAKAMDDFDFEVAAQLHCPSCNKPIINVWSNAEYRPRFCHYCGQALYWGDDNAST